MRRRSILVVVALFLLPSTSSAQQWNDTWSKYGVVDGAVTATLGSVALTARFIGGPVVPRWDREVLLDGPLRRAIGSERDLGERRAARISDIGVLTLMAAPFADAATSAYRYNDLAFGSQYALYSLQSFAVTFGATNLVKVLVGRSRPLIAECFARRRSDPAATCDPRPNVSFFSGHSSVAFTGAGLMCAFGNLAPDRYGAAVAGRLPCVTGLSIAIVTAMLRIVANEHHLTDVLVGSTIGLLSGWALPAARID